MGIGSDDLRLLIKLKILGHIPNECSIIEIGAQQLADSFLASDWELETFRQLFSVEQPCPLPPPLGSPPPDGQAALLNPEAPSARTFWTWLGLHYSAIDIDDSPGSIPLDLNFDNVPTESKGHYQLVTNFGTTEHVANQLNAFKVIHDLTAPGGVMLHHVPAQGMFNHGLVNYNPKFFWMLARSNGYKWLHIDFTASKSLCGLPPDIVNHVVGFSPDFPERARSYGAADCGLLVAMQKAFDIAYVGPLDVNTGSQTTNKILAERYWTVFSPRARYRLWASRKNIRYAFSRLKRRLIGWLG